MKLLVVWRHGRTAWNAERRIQGQRDPGLDATGQQQVRAAARQLAGLTPTALLSSDLRRARQTADALARSCGLKVQVDPRLREVDMNAWQGHTHAEVAAADPTGYARWLAGDNDSPGGGESYGEVQARMLAATLEAWRALTSPRRVLVLATHGGSARLLVTGLLGWPLERWRTMGVLGNARWSLLAPDADVPAGWVLVGHDLGGPFEVSGGARPPGEVEPDDLEAPESALGTHGRAAPGVGEPWSARLRATPGV